MSAGILGLLMAPSTQEPRYHYWQGQSGSWWITTVYPLLSDHLQMPSVYVMVRRDWDGEVRPLYIGQTSNTGRRMNEHLQGKLRAAVGMGGTELHLHFLAKSESERFHIETDLRNGQATPLNQQGVSTVNWLARLSGTGAPTGVIGLGR